MTYLGAQNSIALGVQGIIHIDTGGGAGGSADYLLAKSLRFRSSASAYLSRTFAGTPNTYTYSVWFKRGTLGVQQELVASRAGTASFLELTSSDTIACGLNNVSICTSTAVFRDPAAWYHAVLTVTQSSTVTIYINGVSVATGTAGASSFLFNSSYTNTIGQYGNANSLYFDGEMAEINFVDGQALAPTAFGASSIYNQWLPIKYAGTYGTNGFYLPFSNTTSTSTLVADSSGNGNNWTPNNISLTAGSTYDSLTDVPTLTSATAANYCVLNPLGTAGSTPSNGNLAIASGATVGNRISTFMVTSGKWYWEGSGDGYVGTIIGVQGAQFTGSVSVAGSKSIGYWYSDGLAYWDGGASATGTSYTSSDVIGVALDMTAGNVKFYKNNTLIHDLTFGSGTIPNLSSGVFPGYNVGAATKSVNINFGQQPFTYTAPTGFLPLNTYNI